MQNPVDIEPEVLNKDGKIIAFHAGKKQFDIHEARDPEYKPPMYFDKEFPAGKDAIMIKARGRNIGIGAAKTGSHALEPVEWVRALDLNGQQPDSLWKTVSPNDIEQGALGDCWLIAALSSIAQHPQYVKDIFVENSDGGISHNGKYKVRLFDQGSFRSAAVGKSKSRIIVEVDDFIPCKPGSVSSSGKDEPWFGKSSHCGEIW